MKATVPNKAVMGVPNLSIIRARAVAVEAARFSRQYAPKATIVSASKFIPIWGEGWFGVSWEHEYVWYNEAGHKPFTMRSLAGKTIPMWVNDPDGAEQRKNPKAKTRTLPGGRKQVLIFRRAAKMGQRRKVWRNVGGVMTLQSVPASYPGAPGRIAVNRSQGLMRSGDVDPDSRNPGQIAKGNVGVRWRHPGANGGRFLARGLYVAAINAGLPAGPVQYLNRWSTGPFDSYSVLVHQG